MRALITNDDGIDSAGLRTLAQVAVAAGLKVTVAAPDGERSGSSAAMSGLAQGGRLLVEDRTLEGLADVRTVAVQASPAMIVFLGSHGAFGEPPDIVLAGINRGPNVGLADESALRHAGRRADRPVGRPACAGRLAGVCWGRALADCSGSLPSARRCGSCRTGGHGGLGLARRNGRAET